MIISSVKMVKKCIFLTIYQRYRWDYACQFVQSERGQIVVKVVADAEQFNQEQQKQLISNTQARLGSSLNVTIDIVSALERTANGKICQAICTIKDVL